MFTKLRNLVGAALGAWMLTMPGSAVADQDRLLPEFNDTYWVNCEIDCDTRVFYYRIHFRDDGMVGWQRTRSDRMIYDGNDRWRVAGPYLIIVWTDSTAVEVFHVGGGGMQEYEGPSSAVRERTVIRRARESGGLMPEP